MRIAVFTESYEPIVNGVSVAVATLRDGLRSRGHEVFIFAPRYPGYEDVDGVYRFPSRVTRLAPGYPIPDILAPRMRKAFFSLQPDIVHTQTPFILGIAGLRWARMARVPIVSTNHTLYTEYAHYLPIIPRSVTRAALVKMMKWYYSRCDAVIVPSHPVEEVLRGYGVKTRLEVIKSGVTVSRISDVQEVRRSFGIPDGAFLLLYVGRIAREKNLGLLLRAFKSIQSRYPEARLMMVGSGPYEQTCKTLARNIGIGDGIKFPGMLSRDDVNRVYAAADTFVFPSITETQGLVICEALSAGIPCVAVRAAGIPEVVEEGVDGLLTTNSVDEFADAVCKLISDPDLRNRMSQGAIENSKRFSVETMVEHFESFYHSVIDVKRG